MGALLLFLVNYCRVSCSRNQHCFEAISATHFVSSDVVQNHNIFSNASTPVIPTVMPIASASVVTDSIGACNNCSNVRTPTARAAIILRSPSFSLSNPTSSAPHMIYPLDVFIVNSVVLGNFTSTPTSTCSPTTIGSMLTIISRSTSYSRRSG